jgi:FkbM family methyltransferase
VGILGRMFDSRRKQILHRRFGNYWGPKLYALGADSQTPFQLDSEGRLIHLPTSLCIGRDVEGADAMVAGSSHWIRWAGDRGLRFRVVDGVLLAEIDGIKLFVPNTNDYFTIAEVFREELYRFEVPGEFAFMDVGANIGLCSLYLAKRYGGQIRAFELVPSTAEQAKRNLAFNPELASRIELVPEGLAERSAAATIKIDLQDSACNSMLIPVGDAEVEVRLRDAVEEFNRFASDYPDKKIFVKLDVEGAEYEILAAWNRADCLARIDVLMLEWHLAPGRDVEEIRGFLRRAGLKWFERVHATEPVGFISAWRG